MGSPPWARFRRRASRRSCSPTSSEHSTTASIIGARAMTVPQWQLDRPLDQLRLCRHPVACSRARLRGAQGARARHALLHRSRHRRQHRCARALHAGLRARFRVCAGVNLYRRPADATFIIEFLLCDARGLSARHCAAKAFEARPGQGHVLALRRRRPHPGRHGADRVAEVLRQGAACRLWAARDRLRGRGRGGRRLPDAQGIDAARSSSPRPRLRSSPRGELVLRHAASSIDAEPASYYSAYVAPSPSERANSRHSRKPSPSARKRERGRASRSSGFPMAGRTPR